MWEWDNNFREFESHCLRGRWKKKSISRKAEGGAILAHWGGGVHQGVRKPHGGSGTCCGRG